MRVEIRPVRMEDAPIIQKLATSHPDIVKQTRLPDPYPEDGAENWVRKAVPNHDREREYSFIIKNRKEQIVGVCGLTPQNETDAEIGYWIGKPFWKKGYATAAIQQLLRFAFQEKSFRRVYAITLDDNIGSKRSLEKNGFRFVKNRPDDDHGCNTGGTVAVYEILPEN